MSVPLFEGRAPLWHYLLVLLPRNLVSFTLGWLARIELRHPKARKLLKLFVDTFHIDLSEALLPLEDFASVEAVFTRQLRPDARPILGPMVSPADGTVSQSGPIAVGMAVQAKGLYYSVPELVYGHHASPSADWKPAWAITVYLAPHNYHRVHSPAAGILRQVHYLPGDLWPVNDAYVPFMPRLFAQNERLVFHLDLDGGGSLALVMVGALNVGRIESPFVPGLSTNVPGQRRGQKWQLPEQAVQAGTELGTFMLGSTVVLIFDDIAAKRFRFVQSPVRLPIMMGQAIIQS